jgi:putative addiction module killer protein
LITALASLPFQKFFLVAYPMGYGDTMIEIRQTSQFSKWFRTLRDHNARARINIRIRRLSLGNPGDVKSVGEGVSELRIDYARGYRIYFLANQNEYVLLLIGGDKSSQDDDIAKAKALAREL